VGGEGDVPKAPRRFPESVKSTARKPLHFRQSESDRAQASLPAVGHGAAAYPVIPRLLLPTIKIICTKITSIPHIFSYITCLQRLSGLKKTVKGFPTNFCCSKLQGFNFQKEKKLQECF
jgi:hypothetical protein